ncbi:AAA family ATPase [Proteiniclasticum sp. BAD-10]|uniref:Nuclease SbcCD subunit C n=1 Tax=Proteiniclasticum sediminis TaxID=2804028 RepID=A0A941CNL8_9CLOT|nr:AAA family ATPase [Proteiniclasticum sediminis]MBR0574973.1 AAA family ATPase [Proteiniclasticum sediminis]
MKPMNLSIKCFLGFHEETQVDFRPLYEDKLFLVTGPTGAGKTSIFDAICYALYGEGSGEERNKAKCYRSQLATDQEDMEVSLDFEVRGEGYHIRRVETAKGLNKAFFYSDADPEKLLTKIREVNQEVETLIGLSLDQFKKIVMIPQGEFREFLTAGTKDKSEILKKLFSTEQYEKIQWLIKAKFDEARNLDRNLVTRFQETLKEYAIEGKDIEMGPDALEESLKTEEENLQTLVNAGEALTLQEKSLEQAIRQREKDNQDYREFQRVREEFLKIQGRQNAIKVREKELRLLKKIEAITHLEKQLLGKEGEIKKYKAELTELAEGQRKLSQHREKSGKALDLLNLEFQGLDQLKEEKNRWTSLYEKSLRLHDVMKKLEAEEKRGQENQRKLEYLKKKEEQRRELSLEERSVSESLSQEKIREMELKLSLQESHGRLKMLKGLYEKCQKWENSEAAIMQLKKEEDNLQRNLLVGQNAWTSELKKRSANYAAILRAELEEERPCPVCGSLEHPGVSREAQDFDEEALNRLEENCKKLERDLLEKNALRQNTEKNTAELLEEILLLTDEQGIQGHRLDDIRILGVEEKAVYRRIENQTLENKNALNRLTTQKAGLQEKITDLDRELEHLDDVLKEADENKAILGELRGELKSLQSEGVPVETQALGLKIRELDRTIKDITQRHEEARQAHEEILQKEKELSGRETALHSTLVGALDQAKSMKDQFYEDLDKAEVSRETYELEKGNVQRMGELEEEVTRYYQSYNGAKGAFELLQERGEQLIHREVEPLQEQLKALQQELREKQAEIREKTILYHNLQKAHEKLTKIHEHYRTNKKMLLMVQDLHDTAIVGMGFETFVQSYYFEGILLRANERMHRMTEGRFQLRRRNETESRREKIGLGINVFDEYTGRERDVQSLSGGESFKASLALALGLSDFIESHKASVNLETIFIDEGFGSLDQDSLDNAMECLLELNLSGRIVGIISHVTELKDRIPGKIEVKTVPGKGSVIVTSGRKALMK